MKTNHRSLESHIKSLTVPALALALASPFVAHLALAGTSPGTKDAMAASRSGTERAAVPRDYRASQLIGKEVKEKGVDFGEIKDLVVNMDTGHVRYAILALRGDVGPGEGRLYAIPVEALSMRGKARDLTMNIPTNKWKEKGFPSSRWPDLRNSGYWSEIDRLSGIPAVQPTEDYYAHRASELIGKNVNDVEGKKLGVIRDLVVDMNKQDIHYAVLEFEPGVAQAGKLFSFPLSSFDFREGKTGTLETAKPLVLDMEPAKLQAMQGFDQNHWPDVSPPDRVAGADHHPNSRAINPATTMARGTVG